MNLREILIEFIDSIYFPGYADQMAEEEPEKFNFEYKEFASSLA